MNVSRETQERLDTYLELLRKWSPKINLVAPSTLVDAEKRHVVDSIQLMELAPENCSSWADMGSGGGFPGAVVAIAGSSTDMSFTLI